MQKCCDCCTRCFSYCPCCNETNPNNKRPSCYSRWRATLTNGGMLGILVVVFYLSLTLGKRHPREQCFSAQLIQSVMMGGAFFLGFLVLAGLSLWFSVSTTIRRMFDRGEMLRDGWTVRNGYQVAFVGLCVISGILFMTMLAIIIIILVRFSECNAGGFEDDKKIGTHNQIQIVVLLALELCIGGIFVVFVVSFGFLLIE